MEGIKGGETSEAYDIFAKFFGGLGGFGFDFDDRIN